MSENKTSEKRAKELTLVAVDDGYAMTKIVLADGTQLKFPSLMRSGPAGMGGSSEEVPSYRTNTGEESSGPQGLFSAALLSDISAEDTRFDDYPYGALNRAMVHHALRNAGLGGLDLRIATSLPVRNYYDSNGINKKNIEKKNRSIMSPVVAVDGKPCADIKLAEVYAEGVSAWLDFAIADNGSQRVTLESPAAVIDIGGRTTDTVKVLAGLTVERKSSGTINRGVLDLFAEVRKIIARNVKIAELFGDIGDSQVPRSMVEAVMHTGRFKRHNLDIDLSAEVAAARGPIATEILNEVERKISKGFDLEVMLFVGGGSVIFQEEIKNRFSTASFIKEPEFANARGMMKFMKYVAA